MFGGGRQMWLASVFKFWTTACYGRLSWQWWWQACRPLPAVAASAAASFPNLPLRLSWRPMRKPRQRRRGFTRQRGGRGSHFRRARWKRADCGHRSSVLICQFEAWPVFMISDCPDLGRTSGGCGGPGQPCARCGGTQRIAHSGPLAIESNSSGTGRPQLASSIFQIHRK
jgi:hypothetical protein